MSDKFENPNLLGRACVNAIRPFAASPNSVSMLLIKDGPNPRVGIISKMKGHSINFYKQDVKVG